jgi:hypothetical protein
MLFHAVLRYFNDNGTLFHVGIAWKKDAKGP